MLKKVFKYTDFNGEVQEEAFYFNLSKAEAIELEVSEDGGLSNTLRKMVASNDNREILRMMKEIVTLAVGVRSEDGRRFIKNEDIRNDFMQSPAYDELFMELMTNPNAGAEFIKGVLPADLDLDNLKVDEKGNVVKAPSDYKPKAKPKAKAQSKPKA